MAEAADNIYDKHIIIEDSDPIPQTYYARYNAEYDSICHIQSPDKCLYNTNGLIRKFPYVFDNPGSGGYPANATYKGSLSLDSNDKFYISNGDTHKEIPLILDDALAYGLKDGAFVEIETNFDGQVMDFTTTIASGGSPAISIALVDGENLHNCYFSDVDVSGNGGWDLTITMPSGWTTASTSTLSMRIGIRQYAAVFAGINSLVLKNFDTTVIPATSYDSVGMIALLDAMIDGRTVFDLFTVNHDTQAKKIHMRKIYDEA